MLFIYVASYLWDIENFNLFWEVFTTAMSCFKKERYLIHKNSRDQKSIRYG